MLLCLCAFGIFSGAKVCSKEVSGCSSSDSSSDSGAEDPQRAVQSKVTLLQTVHELHVLSVKPERVQIHALRTLGDSILNVYSFV